MPRPLDPGGRALERRRVVVDDRRGDEFVDDTDVPVLRGWRKKLFGDDALALKRGELALAIKDGEVTVLAPEESASQPSASTEEPKNKA